MNFGNIDWQNVQDAIKVRDRITHPKNAQDLNIDDEEWARIHSGLAWMLKGFTDYFDQVNQKYGQTA
jgi:hypothetical protein